MCMQWLSYIRCILTICTVSLTTGLSATNSIILSVFSVHAMWSFLLMKYSRVSSLFSSYNTVHIFGSNFFRHLYVNAIHIVLDLVCYLFLSFICKVYHSASIISKLCSNNKCGFKYTSSFFTTLVSIFIGFQYQ